MEHGCNTANSKNEYILNCTETCRTKEIMFATPENLWNCVTLSVVANQVVWADDTVDQENQEQMDSVFHFDFMRQFETLGIVTNARDCLWQSCSDPKYDMCSTSLIPHRAETSRIVSLADLAACWVLRTAIAKRPIGGLTLILLAKV